ncbi:MAG: hypothetical protein ACODAD_09450 [Planctomycetota bacterium]
MNSRRDGEVTGCGGGDLHAGHIEKRENAKKPNGPRGEIKAGGGKIPRMGKIGPLSPVGGTVR